MRKTLLLHLCPDDVRRGRRRAADGDCAHRRAATVLSGPSPTRPTRSIGSAARPSPTATTVARRTCSSRSSTSIRSPTRPARRSTGAPGRSTGSAPNAETSRISTTPWRRSIGSRRSTPRAPSATDGASLRTQIRSAQASLGDSRAAVDVATEAKGLSQPRACGGSKADEETRMAALEGLMNMNADDAIPILKDVLKQNDPCRIELRKKARLPDLAEAR